MFCLIIVLGHHLPLSANAPAKLLAPAPQVHPLPGSLAAWQDSAQQGDYFDSLQMPKAGALIWSQFPIRIYVGPAAVSTSDLTDWQQATNAAIADWQPYLPLALTQDSKAADIIIENHKPESRSGDRVRAAETRCFDFYADEFNRLNHRCRINISPNQPGTQKHRMASVRHELGHALGIWRGHSPSETDALYFEQVRTPPKISDRDINTLKRVYEQPTRLGWPLPSSTRPE
ncbi:MAG: peptidase [Thermosynechococcaceae cyanobacterium]